MGSCNGKRPASSADGRGLIPAPAGSCFVLILNASGIEGLDLGEATHLIKTEPMARRDKELQAEARGRRLGAAPGQLQIVQMMMEGTIEEATHEALVEARCQREAAVADAGTSASHAAHAPTKQKAGGKRRRAEESKGADEEEERIGKQAAMLNQLKLLRDD